MDGGRKRRKQDAGSNALSLPSRPAVTASGWHAGSRRAALRPTSFTPRVWRGRARIGERRPTVSTPSCSNVVFSAGGAAGVNNARGSRAPHLKERVPNAPAADARGSPGGQRRVVNRREGERC